MVPIAAARFAHGPPVLQRIGVEGAAMIAGELDVVVIDAGNAGMGAALAAHR